MDFKSIPHIFAVINLGIAILDSILFWAWWRFSFINEVSWLVFIPKFVHAIISWVLYMGVQKRNPLKCKSFCYSELVLLCFEILILLNVSFSPYTYVIWMVIYVGLRGCGIVIVGGFVRTIQSELGGKISFPWNFFRNSVQAQGNSNATAVSKTMPV